MLRDLAVGLFIACAILVIALGLAGELETLHTVFSDTVHTLQGINSLQF